MYSAMIHLLTIFNQKYKFFEKYKFANNKVYWEKKNYWYYVNFFVSRLLSISHWSSELLDDNIFNEKTNSIYSGSLKKNIKNT